MRNVPKLSDRAIGIIGCCTTPVFWLIDRQFFKATIWTAITTNSFYGSLATSLILIPVFWFVVRRINKLHTVDLQLEVEAGKELSEKSKKLEEKALQMSLFSKIVNEAISEIEYILSFKDHSDMVGYASKADKLEVFILDAITRTNSRDINSNTKVKILTPSKNKKLLDIKVSNGDTASEIRKLNLQMNKSVAGDVYKLKEKRISSNVHTETKFPMYDLTTHKSINSIACLPINNDSNIYGVLCVTSQLENAFSADSIDYLEFYTNLLVVVYRLKEMGRYLCEKALAEKKGGVEIAKCRYDQTS